MPGIDRTKPEDMEPIDAAAYLCWGSGRGDLYDAVHAMKRDNERLREELEETRARMESNWSYHRFWEEKFSRHLEKIRQWEAEELDRERSP